MVDRALLHQGEGFHPPVLLFGEELAGTLEGGQGRFPIAADPERLTVEQAEPRIVANRLCRKLLQPFVDHAEPTFGDHVFPISRDEARSLALKPGLQVVIDRLGPLRARLEVGRRVDVQSHHLGVASLVREPALEELPE